MNPERTTIYLGPPGCGKTTKLISIVLGYMAEGVKPSNIAYLSFTRRARLEAIGRIMRVTGGDLKLDNFRYFSTIHSICYRHLGQLKRPLLTAWDYREIAALAGIDISVVNRLDCFAHSESETTGDKILKLEDMARSRGVSCADILSEIHEPTIGVEQLEYFGKLLRRYKQDHGKIDFTDMLTQWLKEGTLPNIRVMIVDEAQDLSALQWRAVHRMTAPEAVTHTYIAGDDDQAIFAWAGADVTRFITLPGQAETLGKSYRVPQQVKAWADELIREIPERRPKVWESRTGPTDLGSAVELVPYTHFTSLPYGNKESWLVLTRTNHLGKWATDRLMETGLMVNSDWAPVRHTGTLIEGAKLWHKVASHQTVTGKEVRRLAEILGRVAFTYGNITRLQQLKDEELLDHARLAMNFGLKLTRAADVDVVFAAYTEQEREYVRAVTEALKQGKEPVSSAVTVSTIHQAKGAEADNIVLFTDLSSRIIRSIDKTMPDEVRLWYVALTRTRRKLHLVTPRTQNNIYDQLCHHLSKVAVLPIKNPGPPPSAEGAGDLLGQEGLRPVLGDGPGQDQADPR